MRRYSFDPYEFDTPDSEEFVEIVVSTPRQHNDLDTFLVECKASGSRTGISPLEWPQLPFVTGYLKHCIGMDLPHPSLWRTATVITDNWDDVEIAIATGSHLIWYHWFTTA